jgi:hypothetical protein
MSDRTGQTIDRIYAAVGAIILACTATDWLVRPVAAGGEFDQVLGEIDHTLWEMLGVVNDRYQSVAALGVVVIVVYALACTVGQLRLRPSQGSWSVIVFAWLATLAAGLIMLNTDGGHRPGTGAWVTLVVCALSAIGSVIIQIRGPLPRYERSPAASEV